MKLSKRFTATLEKSPAEGRLDLCRHAGVGGVLRHPRARQGARSRRRPAVRECVHGARRWPPQAADQGRAARAIAKKPGDRVTVHFRSASRGGS